MKRVSPQLKKYIIYSHPFLFALYHTLFLFSLNIHQFREEVLITPVLLSLFLALLVFFILSLLTRSIGIAAIISSYLILAFFSYGRIREAIKYFKIDFLSIHLNADQIIFISAFILLITIIFISFKFRRPIAGINKILTVLSLILVAITVFNIAYFEITSGRLYRATFQNEDTEDQDSQNIEKKRDIYYFVFDRYAGQKTLEAYGFDNSEFYNYLKKKGFYIAAKSTSNYPKTFLSLGSSLNFKYINFLTEQTNGGGTSDESPVTPLVKNNRVVKFLKSKGYKYIHVGSGWDPTRSNENADINFVLTGGNYPFADEFTDGLLHTTLASPILKELFHDPTAISEDPKDNDHRSRVLYQFEVFKEVVKIDGPKFVFTHILLPHNPYVLDENCNPLPEKVTILRAETENYLRQLQCTNKKIKETVDLILAASDESIIVLTADEGPLPLKYPIGWGFDWKNANTDSLNEKFPIFAAYFLPGLKKNPIYETITPVNNFRLLFNSYFGTNYSKLEDRNYIFEDNKNYYKFIDVTDKVD